LGSKPGNWANWFKSEVPLICVSAGQGPRRPAFRRPAAVGALMGRTLGLSLVVEGIEREAQLAQLDP
jgi:hypothetical protein